MFFMISWILTTGVLKGTSHSVDRKTPFLSCVLRQRLNKSLSSACVPNNAEQGIFMLKQRLYFMAASLIVA
jgi:hypothetical protein